MEITKSMSEEICEKFIKRAYKLQLEEIYQIKQLGKKRGITDVQRMQLLNEWRYKRFNGLAQDFYPFGLKFRNHINPLDSSVNLVGNIFSVGPFERLLDNIIIKIES